MTLHGLFSRSQRTERSVLPYAQLNEKTFWRQPRGPTVPRFKQVIALQNSDDLKHTLSSCVLWITAREDTPMVCLSYKLFDRWIHKPVVVQIENWMTTSNDDEDGLKMGQGDLSVRHFRLIDRLIHYLIPQLERLTIDVTWNPALQNPKLQVPNLNAVTIHTTEQGVEFICSDQSTAIIDLNVKEASLMLVMEPRRSSCHSCLALKMFTIRSLSDAIRVLENGIAHGTLLEPSSSPLSPRREGFIVQAVKKLDVTKDTHVNVLALQQVLSSMSPQSSFRSSSSPVVSLWIQYGLVPCLLSLLLDPIKNHEHGLFLNIKNVCKALIIEEHELASKAILLYICRALQQYGLQCRTVLVLLSHLMEESFFRKIAIEHFDLAEIFGRLLLIHSPCSQSEMTSLNEGSGLLVEQQIQVPPVYVINEQLQLPEVATITWRVPPLPMRRNPPEQPLAQISILKNLLLLSPLQNDDVESRNGQLVTMLLTFIDCGLMEQQEEVDLHPVSGQEMDSFWPSVMRLAFANVQEHTISLPRQYAFLGVPKFQAYKASLDLKPMEGFARSVTETMLRHRGNTLWVHAGFKTLIQLVSSSPSPSVALLVVTQLSRFYFSIRLPPLATDIGLPRKESLYLAQFELLEMLLSKCPLFPIELLGQFVHCNLIGMVVQALRLAREKYCQRQMRKEDASIWSEKCWKLLTSLIRACRKLHDLQFSNSKSQILTEIEEQLVQKLVDAFTQDGSDAVNLINSLEFLRVYLDSQQCLLYDNNEMLKGLLFWLRDMLNLGWMQKGSCIVCPSLEVLSVICSHVGSAYDSATQSFLDGLLSKLGWIPPNEASASEGNALMYSHWLKQSPGPSRPSQQIARYRTLSRDLEIQLESMEEDGNESESSSNPREMKSKKGFGLPVYSHPIMAAPRSSFEYETTKPKDSTEKPKLTKMEETDDENQKLCDLVIPQLDLGSLATDRDGIAGRRSVASTIFSSEYPVRPLSQISDASGMHSIADDPRPIGSLLSVESNHPFFGQMLDSKIYASELYRETPVPPPSRENSQKRKLFNQKMRSRSESSKESLEVETSVETSTWIMVDKAKDPETIKMDVNRKSQSALDLTLMAPRISVAYPRSASLHAAHSFDVRRSRPSLALMHLIGDLAPQNSDESSSTPRFWAQRSIPSIVFIGRDCDRTLRPESVGDDISVTIGDVSETTKETEMEMEFMADDEDDNDEEEQILSECPSLLATKYRLTKCDGIQHPLRHGPVLKTFLSFLAAEYLNKNRERALTKVIALGLHLNFHYVPMSMILTLKDWAIQLPDRSSYTLLKMLAKPLFDESQYPSQKRIGRGVFSSIHECKYSTPGGPSKCCVKVIDLPKDPYGMRSMKDLFTELFIVQKLQGLPRVIKLYDYGVTEDNLFMVTKLYRMDLLAWRQQIVGSVVRSARMMFKIFAEILKTVEAVHDAGVVHFDIKASNILLEPLDDTDGNLFELNDTELPFRIVLADFGEALLIEHISSRLTRSRGTQAFMSPEMLVSGAAAKRRKPGIWSDAWSLGCLFFELITGEAIFDDSDYSEFHTRLTTSSRTLIDASKVQMIPEKIREPCLICLSYLLVRNPSLRAPLHAVVSWIEQLLATHLLPSPGRVAFTTDENFIDRLESSDVVLLPETAEMKFPRDFLPLSLNICQISFVAAMNSWKLSEHNITHVVFMHFTGTPRAIEELKHIRNATLRANGVLFEVQLSTDDETIEWMDHCHRCAEKVLSSCLTGVPYRIAIVAGKNTGQYLKLMVRYLTQHDRRTNLDSALLM